MRILVTGVGGFMGSHLAKALLKEGHEVHGIDDLSGGYEENVPPFCDFHMIDLVDSESVSSMVSFIEPEVIFHLAADATEGRSQFTPTSCTKRNVLATVNLLTAGINAKMKKFIFTSSMAVYGEQTTPFFEAMERKPVDVYGVNKAMSERIIEVMAGVHGFQYNIVRPHNVYGPHQNMADPYRNVVAIFINKLLKKEKFYIYGDGKQTRAFSYIDDFTPYMIQLMKRKDLNGEIFNIGPTRSYSINKLGEIVSKAFKVPFDPIYMPKRPVEVKHAFCTVDKAEQMLGYKTTVHLEEGIKKMVKWAKKLGPQETKYLDDLEIENKQTPETWAKKLI